MSKCSEWKKEIDHAIAETCWRIIREPLLYFSEADIQQLLVEELHKIKALKKLYETSIPKAKGAKTKYKTSLLHREYGKGNRERFDIVILDPDDVKKIDNVNLQTDKGYVYPAFAFELGTEKTTDISNHMENDLEKLENVQNTGYLIHFYKDVTTSASDTKNRERTEERIQKTFKKEFENQRKQSENEKIKYLGILLRTYRNQKKTRGKCEIFGKVGWERFNINRKKHIINAILELLESN